MKKTLLLIVLALMAQTIKAQTVAIGTQTWTAKNLDVATYSDGTTIPEVQNEQDWASLSTGAWCYYNNDPANDAIYGKLYNWYAVAGIWNEASKTDVSQRKNLAPTGYHVPSDEEWTTLTTYLGGESIAGGKMKETGTAHWNSPNLDATNSSGFTGLPGGFRLDYENGYFGKFNKIGSTCIWWSLSEYDKSSAWYHAIEDVSGVISTDPDYKMLGNSVRCIRDNALSKIIFETNSFKIYPNPVIEFLTIESGIITNIVNKSYTITDALGKVVLKGKLNEGDTTINVENLSKGIYCIKIANNKASKFIKE